MHLEVLVDLNKIYNYNKKRINFPFFFNNNSTYQIQYLISIYKYIERERKKNKELLFQYSFLYFYSFILHQIICFKKSFFFFKKI